MAPVRFNFQLDEGRFRLSLAAVQGGWDLVTGDTKRTFSDGEAAFDAAMLYVQQFPSMRRKRVEDIYLKLHGEIRRDVTQSTC
jgi:hypothetical protein